METHRSNYVYTFPPIAGSPQTVSFVTSGNCYSEIVIQNSYDGVEKNHSYPVGIEAGDSLQASWFSLPAASVKCTPCSVSAGVSE